MALPQPAGGHLDGVSRHAASVCNRRITRRFRGVRRWARERRTVLADRFQHNFFFEFHQCLLDDLQSPPCSNVASGVNHRNRVARPPRRRAVARSCSLARKFCIDVSRKVRKRPFVVDQQRRRWLLRAAAQRTPASGPERCRPSARVSRTHTTAAAATLHSSVKARASPAGPATQRRQPGSVPRCRKTDRLPGSVR